jgi:hypothetical protein
MNSNCKYQISNLRCCFATLNIGPQDTTSLIFDFPKCFIVKTGEKTWRIKRD